MVLLGSLVIALKCTRPRQRFMYVIGRYSMTEGGMCQEEEWNNYFAKQKLFSHRRWRV